MSFQLIMFFKKSKAKKFWSVSKEIVVTKKEGRKREFGSQKEILQIFYNFYDHCVFIELNCLYKIGPYVGFSYSAKEESEKGLAK